jgi:PIN domain nuclease of toxin-antitoxin system
MRLLRDTHVVIWWVDQDHLLSPDAHAAIVDPSNELLISAGTIWETSIKVGLGKLSLSLAFRQWMDQAIRDLRAAILPITVEFAEAQAGLPRHHGEPFDRLLLAQATVEQVPIMSNDAVFDAYGVKRLW